MKIFTILASILILLAFIFIIIQSVIILAQPMAFNYLSIVQISILISLLLIVAQF